MKYKVLKVKKECQGVIISKDTKFGICTFDPYKISPEHYWNYKNLGFNIFNEEEHEHSILQTPVSELGTTSKKVEHPFPVKTNDLE